MDIIKRKDVEIKQYRLEGARLRRSTVTTEIFDEAAYRIRHRYLTDEVANYLEIEHVLHCINPELNTMQTIGVEKPSVSKLVEKANEEAMRSRKRKALEAKSKHVELKAKQRCIKPTMQYKDSESQEDDLNAIVKLDDDDNDVKDVLNGQVKNEMQSSLLGNGQENNDNILDIMAMVNTAAEKSAKVFNYTKPTK
ncbi:hypothetical protein KR093_001404 [Drosophila rubida]|uniref:Uncharacterized protein n=1 Tax=Drosophila rubida TaxID=30044 RepID=A0AAD4PR50_9MUSC|nr:hypothetical protein KR093_001404 [Drosophila rubida]